MDEGRCVRVIGGRGYRYIGVIGGRGYRYIGVIGGRGYWYIGVIGVDALQPGLWTSIDAHDRGGGVGVVLRL